MLVLFFYFKSQGNYSFETLSPIVCGFEGFELTADGLKLLGSGFRVETVLAVSMVGACG